MSVEINYDYLDKHLSLNSLCSFCEESKQIMIYGPSHCWWYSVIHIVSERRDPRIEKIFSYKIGIIVKKEDSYSQIGADAERTTTEGHKIEQIVFDFPPEDFYKKRKRECKTALVNMVLENYKRQASGLPIIPILFIIDIDNNPYPFNPQTLCNKTEEFNTLVTHKELRRAYKLCNTIEHFKLQEVANDSFKFVKLTLDQQNDCIFESVDPPWKAPEWEQAWSERIQNRVQKNYPLGSVSWDNSLRNLAFVFDAKV